MKAVVVLAVVCVFAVVCHAEECRDTRDCNHVTCPETDYTLECHNRQCTCTHTSRRCTSVADCGQDDNCRSDWHCVDNVCRCGFGFGGLPGFGK